MRGRSYVRSTRLWLTLAVFRSLKDSPAACGYLCVGRERLPDLRHAVHYVLPPFFVGLHVLPVQVQVWNGSIDKWNRLRIDCRRSFSAQDQSAASRDRTLRVPMKPRAYHTITYLRGPSGRSRRQDQRPWPLPSADGAAASLLPAAGAVADGTHPRRRRGSRRGGGNNRKGGSHGQQVARAWRRRSGPACRSSVFRQVRVSRVIDWV